MPLRRALFFAASFFVIFFCIGLRLGGDRLIATDESASTAHAEEAKACSPILFAFYDSGDIHRDPLTPDRDAAEQGAGQAKDRATRKAADLRCANASPARDSNGNVLQKDRYTQAVYRAFSLGDAGG